MDNVEAFIAGGGSVIWAWNRGTTAASSSAAALTSGLRDAFGISAFGAPATSPLTMARTASLFAVSGAVPNLTPSTDLGDPNGNDIASLFPTATQVYSGGTSGGIVRRVAVNAPSYYVANLIDDYRTDASFTGTRFVDSDGDGIGDLVEFYRSALLSGLYMVDTNNNGIDDRDPDIGP
jgi:hypothetical protein